MKENFVQGPAAGPAESAITYRLVWFLVFCIAWGDMANLPYDVQASRVLTVVVFLVWLAAVLRGQKIRKPATQHLLMLLFVVWSGTSLFTTEDPVRSVRRVLSYCQLFLVVWLIYQSSGTADKYCRLFRAYLLGCFVAFAGLVYHFVLGVASGDGRYTSPGFDPNDLSVSLAIGIPIAWYLTFSSRKTSWVYRLYIPCAVIAGLLTASRTGLVALGASMIFPLLAMPKLSRRAKVSLLVMAVICGGTVSYFWNEIPIGRLSTITEQLGARDLNGRVEIWRRGFETFFEHPFVGIGAGAFSKGVSGGQLSMAAHNAYLGVLVEHGLAGLLIFLSVIGGLVQRSANSPPLERRLWMVLLVTWAIAAATLSWENRELTWLLWGLCGAQPWRKMAGLGRRFYRKQVAYA